MRWSLPLSVALLSCKVSHRSGDQSAPAAPGSADASVAPAAPISRRSVDGDALGSALPRLVRRELPLPARDALSDIDDLSLDERGQRLWIPIANVGTVCALDLLRLRLTRIEGLSTSTLEKAGRQRVVGPSSVASGGGMVFVGNRATSQVCAFREDTLAHGPCVTFDTWPDSLQYVPTHQELWISTPRDHALRVLDAHRQDMLVRTSTIQTDGEPEGHAVDPIAGRFYTNLEDRDQTLAIDLESHKKVATWSSQCGPKGGRGLGVDAERGHLFVACTDRVQVLDLHHGGALLDSQVVGEGVDEIAFLPRRHLLYVVAASTGLLTVFEASKEGELRPRALGDAVEGAHLVAADAQGNAYVADGIHARILTFEWVP